jgi:hypothetical protein
MGRTFPFRGERGKVRNRRIFPVPAGSGEGPFTEPTAAAHPWQQGLSRLWTSNISTGVC